MLANFASPRVLLLVIAIQKKAKRPASIAAGLLVSYITTLIILGFGEAYFRFVYADSGWGFTLAHQKLGRPFLAGQFTRIS